MKLFQIAFLLFNIVAISATDNLKLRPQKVQIQWSQYFNREKGIVEDVQFMESDGSGMKNGKAYEQRSDFLKVSDMAEQDKMMEAAFWVARSKAMKDAADIIVAGKTTDGTKIKFADTAPLPSRTEITKATYAVTFIGLDDKQVAELMNVFGDAATPTLPKLITGEVRIERNLDKFFADMTFDQFGRLTDPRCSASLKEHFNRYFAMESEQEPHVDRWRISEGDLAKGFQDCMPNQFSSEEAALEFAQQFDKLKDGYIDLEELRHIEINVGHSLKTIISRQPQGAPPNSRAELEADAVKAPHTQ